jgi:hypothetical protein
MILEQFLKCSAKSVCNKRVNVTSVSRVNHRHLEVYTPHTFCTWPSRTKVVLNTPMLLRGPCSLPPSHSIVRAGWTARSDTLRKSIHSSVVRRKGGSDQNKLYTKSLLLPCTTFSQWTDPLKTEVQLRKKTCDDLYRWQVRSQCCTFRAMPRTTDIGP